MKKYKTLREFYPFYLSEHQNPTNRLLHFIGTTLVFLILILGLGTQNYSWLWYCPLAGYFFAWVGHFFVEKNRPATFTYPFKSLLCDFWMYFDLLRRKIPFGY